MRPACSHLAQNMKNVYNTTTLQSENVLYRWLNAGFHRPLDICLAMNNW